jgi:DNA-binding beta-propeller fold protein YncE
MLMLVAVVACSRVTAGGDAPQSDDKSAKAAKSEPEKVPLSVENHALHNPFIRRIPALPLTGGTAWLNTAGPLDLEKLRGKFVILDFWTFCCINCMHILPELKKLEQEFPNELVVIGVHSAKFDGERDSKNITDAILRYDIRHPVVNDSNMTIWRRYGVNTWPTMLLIDPEGQVVLFETGEFEAPKIAKKLHAAIPWYRKKGLLDSTPLHFDLAQYHAEPTPLSFPGKILADPAGDRLFISDSGHHRIVISQLDGKLLDVIGSGQLGRADGDFAQATFHHPQGMALLGDMLYVADTENHLLRKVDLKARTVKTIAGVGEQGRSPWLGTDPKQHVRHPRPGHRWVGKPLASPLNSPWDLLIHGDELYIAMAGPHQIWQMPLDESEIGPYAGNGREDIVDGPLLPRAPYDEGAASFAQPSGLTSDGKQLFVADSEGSSIRAVPFDRGGQVTTVIGTAHLGSGRLFDFGDVDGRGSAPRLQHCLGVAFADNLLYVADTYNNKIKVIEPSTRTCTTLVGSGKSGREEEPASFDEPAGLTAANHKLYVADTNNHLVRVVDLKNGNRVSTLAIAGLEPPKQSESAAEPTPEADAVALPTQMVRAEGTPCGSNFESISRRRRSSTRCPRPATSSKPSGPRGRSIVRRSASRRDSRSRRHRSKSPCPSARRRVPTACGCRSITTTARTAPKGTASWG